MSWPGNSATGVVVTPPQLCLRTSPKSRIELLDRFGMSTARDCGFTAAAGCLCWTSSRTWRTVIAFSSRRKGDDDGAKTRMMELRRDRRGVVELAIRFVLARMVA